MQHISAAEGLWTLEQRYPFRYATFPFLLSHKRRRVGRVSQPSASSHSRVPSTGSSSPRLLAGVSANPRRHTVKSDKLANPRRANPRTTLDLCDANGSARDVTPGCDARQGRHETFLYPGKNLNTNNTSSLHRTPPRPSLLPLSSAFTSSSS